MTPIKTVNGKLVVRTNCDKATPFLRALNAHLEAIARECRRRGQVPQAADIGCGNGRNSRYLDSFGFHVYSFDQHDDYERAAKWDFEKHALPILKRSMGVVLSQFTLMFFPPGKREELITEALDICGDPGMVVFEMQDVKSGMMRKNDIEATVELIKREAIAKRLHVIKQGAGKIAVTNWRHLT